MGHDIEICEHGNVVATMYHTSNWQNTGVDKVGLPYMAHGHTGRRIARKLIEMLEDFKDCKSNDTILDLWGMSIQTGKEPDPFFADYWRRGRFKTILKMWLDAAVENPDAVWYSDQVWEITPLYDNEGDNSQRSSSD